MPPSRSVAKSVTAHSGRFSLRITTRSPLPTPHACSWRAVAVTQRCNCSAVIGFHTPFSRRSIVRSCLRLATVKKTSFSVRIFITHHTWLLRGSLHPTQQDVQNRIGGVGQRVVLRAEHPRRHHLVDGAKKTVDRKSTRLNFSHLGISY